MSLFRCPHTHKVVTSSGEVIYKECGKCRYCRMKRSAILSAGLTDAASLYKYVIFFTLTYNNENLPIAYDFSVNPLTDSHVDFYLDAQRFAGTSDDSESGFLKFNDVGIYTGVDVVPPVPNNSDVNGFGVLCKRDIQLFNKRLRRFIDYDKEGLFKTLPASQRNYKYFICGEYGPRTMRPHYHGLFFTNEEEVSQALEYYYYKAWSLCDDDKRRYDFQYVNGSAAGYVSSYVTTYVNLPRLLQNKFTRPFYVKSKHLGISEDEEEKVFEEVSNGVVERVKTEVQRDGCLHVVNSQLPYSVVCRLFPKCIGFRDIYKDAWALLKIYSPLFTSSQLQLSQFKCLGSDFYDSLHYNVDGTYGSYRWRNISCARSCFYVCQKFDISVIDYLAILVGYYSKLDMYYLRNQYLELEEFSASLPLSKAVCYQHVFSQDSFFWLQERLPYFIPLYGDDGMLCFDLFSDDSFKLSRFPEFRYYGVSPSDLFEFYDFNSVYDRFELNVGRLRSHFDFTFTDYYRNKQFQFDDIFERKLMSKKINNSRYALLLMKEPLL